MALLAILSPAVSRAQYYDPYGGSYGGMTYYPESGTFQYYSERDLRRLEKERRQQEESDRREEDKRQRREEERQRKQAQREANQYQSQAPVDAPLEIHSSRAPRTLDSAMDAFRPQAQYVPPDVPPQRESLLLIGYGDEFCYYGEGKFYSAEGDDLQQIPGPPGAIIFELPAGAQTVATAAGNYYVAMGTWYHRVMITGTSGYKVVPKPEGLADPTSADSTHSGS